MSTISFDQIKNTMGSAASRAESNLQADLDSISGDDDIDSGELLAMQTKIQEWTLTVSMCSSCSKELGDCLHGIVQKIS